MTDVRIQRADGSEQVPDIDVPLPRRPPDPPVPVVDGVELSRLLRLAALTPPQAVGLAADLLGAVAGRSGAAAEGDQVITDRIVIGADGLVVVCPPEARRDGGAGPAARASSGGVVALLADIAQAAGRRARHAGPDVADPLLAELDRAAAELPVAGVPAVARRLDEAAAGIDRTAVRAELGALAGAVRGQAAPAQGTARTGGPATPAASGTAPRTTGRDRRTTRRRVGAWVLSVVVLAGIVVLEDAVLHDKVVRDIGVLLDAGRAGGTSAPTPQPDGLPVVPPAPAAAGTVRGVDLRPFDACTPGAACTVRLLVRVVPGTGPQVVTWSYRIVDRCTGAVAPAPGASVTVPAGQERVAVVATVPLPPAPGVGVVAVTEVPAVAASAPLLVGSCRSPAG